MRLTGQALAFVTSLACVACDPSRSVTPPSILAQPLGMVATMCGGAETRVQAVGEYLTYQWLRDGLPVPEANAATLRLSRVGLADDGAAYAVRVSNSAGSVTSDPAILRVSDVIGPITVATSREPRELSLHGSQIAWTSSEGISLSSLDCSGPLERPYSVGTGLVTGDEAPWGISLSTTHVYWTDGNLGLVAAVPVDGGTPNVLWLEGGPGPYELAAAAGRLYWTRLDNAVWTVDAVGTIEALIVGERGAVSTAGVVADDLNVYWINLSEGSIGRMPLQGGQVTTVVIANQHPVAFTVADGFVYWAESDSSSPQRRTTIHRAPREGGVQDMLADVAGSPVHLTADTAHVYWTSHEGQAGSGAIYRVRTDGSEPAEVFQGSLNFPVGIVVDEANVFWTELGTSVTSGRVVRMAK